MIREYQISRVKHTILLILHAYLSNIFI